MPHNKKFRFKNKSPNNVKDVSVNTYKSVESAILETLAYRSIFDYPMTFYQIVNFLFVKKKVDASVVLTSLQQLVKTHQVSVKSDRFYYLHKSRTVNWIDRRHSSKKLIQKLEKLIPLLAKIPWIKFIGITGSIAAFNADLKSDIDILIVTKHKRLWLTRGFVFLILKILGELRTDSNPEQKICPNIFMDEKHLAWPKNRRNIYVAHEVVMMYPMLDRGDTYFRFLHDNSWIKGYFGNLGNLDFNLPILLLSRNFLIDKIEEFAMKLQLKYMSGKQTTEILKNNLIHFNKTDSTEKILADFDKLR